MMDNADWIKDTVKTALPTITLDQLEKETNKLHEDGLTQDSPDPLRMVEVGEVSDHERERVIMTTHRSLRPYLTVFSMTTL